jgi:hypothetical protein
MPEERVRERRDLETLRKVSFEDSDPADPVRSYFDPGDEEDGADVRVDETVGLKDDGDDGEVVAALPGDTHSTADAETGANREVLCTVCLVCLVS